MLFLFPIQTIILLSLLGCSFSLPLIIFLHNVCQDLEDLSDLVLTILNRHPGIFLVLGRNAASRNLNGTVQCQRGFY
jgi:hypothetical protein